MKNLAKRVLRHCAIVLAALGMLYLMFLPHAVRIRNLERRIERLEAPVREIRLPNGMIIRVETRPVIEEAPDE